MIGNKRAHSRARSPSVIIITVIGETPDVGQVHGEADDGEQKVDLFVPRLAGLVRLVAGNGARSRRRRLIFIERRDFSERLARRAIAAPVPASFKKKKL